MKKFTLLMTLVSIIIPQTYAGMLAPERFYDDKDNAAMAENAKNTFELINESSTPLWITVVNGSKIVADAQEVGARSAVSEKDVFAAPINTNEQTKIAVYTQKPELGNIEIGFFGQVKFAGNPAKYQFPKSKTVYITYKDGEIVPTTPELPGGINTTRTGLSLDNNVKLEEISSQVPQASMVVKEE